MSTLPPILLAYWFCLSTLIGQEPLAPSRHWQPGDVWQIHVNLEPAQAALKPAEGKLYVVLQGTEKVDNSLCWKLFLNPEKALDPGHRYFVYLDKDCGLLRKLMRYDPKALAQEKLDLLNYQTLAQGPLALFPFEIMPADSEKAPDDSGLLKWTARHQGSEVFLEGVTRDRQFSDIIVRQTWREGEKWWREYERRVSGRIQLTARLVNPPPDPVVVEKKLAKDRKSLEERLAKAKAEREEFAKLHPLAGDRKLHARLSIVDKSPKLAHVLAQLSVASGRTLTLSDHLSSHEPELGVLEIADARVYAIMELIAARELKDGKWEQSPDGYRLTGTSLALPKTPDKASTPGSSWPWLIYTALAGVVSAGAYWVVRRSKAKKYGKSAAA
jgi:hypothetical protein